MGNVMVIVIAVFLLLYLAVRPAAGVPDDRHPIGKFARRCSTWR